MKIAVDAMGGDYAPRVIVFGAVRAAKKYHCEIVLVGDEAKIREVRDCWGCTACMKECPVSAIGYFLGADLGGSVSTMTNHKEGHYYHWHIRKADQQEVTITIDRENANQY